MSGFVFKVQANMNPSHRDRIAFIRVCSGKFERGMVLTHEPTGKPLVAIDTVDAGVGDLVLIASGSSARQTNITKDRPVDAVIMALLDNLEVDGEVTFRKS